MFLGLRQGRIPAGADTRRGGRSSKATAYWRRAVVPSHEVSTCRRTAMLHLLDL